MDDDIADKPAVIGWRIYTLRVAMGYADNQGGFAALCGISAPALANYEAGERRPSMDQLVKISRRTGADYNWLLHGELGKVAFDLAEKIRAAERQVGKRA